MDGRQQFWRRYGESRGHHRGLRVGHVHTGVAWELERTVISLRRAPGRQAGIQEGQAQTGDLLLPESDTNESRRAQGIGNRAECEENRDGEAVVLADHSTDGCKTGKAGKVGNQDPRDPLEGR